MGFIENNDGAVYMTSPNIQARHAFTTRFGGVSGGDYASLNLGQSLGDDPGLVRENYAIIRRALKLRPGSFACSYQVHGAQIRIAAFADCGEPPPPPAQAADGLITREHGVALTVFTADCLPILLFDPVQRAIGAVHSGWRGTAADIVGEAVRKMSREFGCDPADIRAAIGPGISVCCYETGADVADALRLTLGESVENCITARGEKYMADLKEANRILLERAGLLDIEVSDECTSCRCDKYWSHRRTKGRRGSQAAIIALER